MPLPEMSDSPDLIRNYRDEFVGFSNRINHRGDYVGKGAKTKRRSFLVFLRFNLSWDGA